MNRLLAACLLVGMWGAAQVRAQDVRITLFDEPIDSTSTHYVFSSGKVSGGDYLQLTDGRLPLETGQTYREKTSGRIEYRHITGSWELSVAPANGQPVDLSSADTLVMALNGPAALAGGELPRLALEDADGNRTGWTWLSTPQNVRIDAARSGFATGSPANAVLSARYVDALPSTVRRPGFPEDLVVTFSDTPSDTSLAAIGMPSVPVWFSVATASGRRLDFRFRNVDGDSTLSAAGEYIEVLLPEFEGSTRLRPAWRIEYERASTPSSPVRPGSGDVYTMAVAFDAFELDASPETWQILRIATSELEADDFAWSKFKNLVFTYGETNPEVRMLWFDLVEAVVNDDEAFLDLVERRAFDFFWNEANPINGLIRDRSQSGSACSIASVGFGLSAITLGIDRGWITREQGVTRVLATLRFFWKAPQGPGVSNTAGYKGFFYHFLDMNTGRRNGYTELSTIDSALLLAGVVHAGQFFDGTGANETEIRALADSIYQRVDWQWALNGTNLIAGGWFPESGFIDWGWRGYNEAMILYILALGSPTHPVGPQSWTGWVSGYSWATHYGFSFVEFPPLFGHQYSHCWIDFRGIQDAYMRGKGIDYFENSRRATLAQRAYHIDNPRGFPNYGRDEWGLTASDVPNGYAARGAPPAQNDEGTIAPTAPGGSIAFTPEESIAALRHMYQKYGSRLWGKYGFRDAYNVSKNWFGPDYIGIDQGPIALMIENHRTERVWDVFMQSEDIRRGLERAGFSETNTGTEEPVPDTDEPVLEISPIPTRGELHVSYTSQDRNRLDMDVFDILGRRVLTLFGGTFSGSLNRVFDVSSLAAGTYVLRMDSEGTIVTRKFIVIR